MKPILILFSCFSFIELGRTDFSTQWLQFIIFWSYIAIRFYSQILSMGHHNFLSVLLQGLLGQLWATHDDRWFFKSEQLPTELSSEDCDVKIMLLACNRGQ